MVTETAADPGFTPEQQAELRDFWELYSARRESLARASLEALSRIPELDVDDGLAYLRRRASRSGDAR